MDEHNLVKFLISRDSSFGLGGIQKTGSYLCLDARPCRCELFCRITGRSVVMSKNDVSCNNRNCNQHALQGVAMSTESEVCHHCNKQGNCEPKCPELANNKGKRERTKKHSGGVTGSEGGAGQARCSYHNTTTLSGSTQWAPHHQQGIAYTVCWTQ